jgi:ribosomal-protein-alanine N-acetyltransferase
MICLTTERLVIRDPLPTDINDWHRLLSDPKTMYYLPEIMTRSLDESRQNLETAIADVQNPNRTKFFFAIEDKASGVFIGTVGYTVTQNTPVGRLVGMGYFILPEYHGQGYMTEAVRELLRFAFEDNGVYRVSTGCMTENRASERVMQKCGMIREAERKDFIWHDGRMKNRVEYRLLKNEWLSMREMTSGNFWFALDKLVAESEIVIDRPKGSAHPRYPDFIYPLDYGYLKGTTAMDGGGIDVWRGSDPAGRIDAIMCIVDLMKRDSEIKVLIGCTEDEKADVYRVHNETEYMKGVLIRRDDL